MQVEEREAPQRRAQESSSSAHWVRWMREALWSALRLIKPAVDEVAASRAAWVRTVPHLGRDGAPPSPAASPPTETKAVFDDSDRTEVLYPGAAHRRRPPSDKK